MNPDEVNMSKHTKEEEDGGLGANLISNWIRSWKTPSQQAIHQRSPEIENIVTQHKEK